MAWVLILGTAAFVTAPDSFWQIVLRVAAACGAAPFPAALFGVPDVGNHSGRVVKPTWIRLLFAGSTAPSWSALAAAWCFAMAATAVLVATSAPGPVVALVLGAAAACTALAWWSAPWPSARRTDRQPTSERACQGLAEPASRGDVGS